MPLNLSSSGGDFTPFVKYNAKSGRWSTKNDSGDEVEVTNMTAIFDFANIQVGWLGFREGEAPDYVFDINGRECARPSDKHRRGFVLNLYSEKNLGGTREFASTADVVKNPIKALYETYENASEAKAGKLPVVKFTGTAMISRA